MPNKQDDTKNEMTIMLQQLQSMLLKCTTQIGSNNNVASEAYKAYVIDTTKKAPDKLIEDACKDLLFLIGSLEAYSDLIQYTQMKNVNNSSVESACMLMKVLTGEELIPRDAFASDKKSLSDISARLAAKGMTPTWLLQHGLASEKDILKLQTSQDISGINYKKIKNGIRIESVDISGGVILPEFIEDLPVTQIGERAFYKRKDITSVILPRYLSEIGDAAFAESGLVSIIIPNNVERIGQQAFQGCKHLERIHLPEKLKNIKYKTFASCSALTTISIPANVTTIGDWAFEGCRKLKNIQIPKSVTRIGYVCLGSKVTIYCDEQSRANRYARENYMSPCKPYKQYDEVL